VGVWVWVYMHEESECGRTCMGWLRLVGSLELQVSFAEYSLFYRALLQKRPIILRNLLVEATPYEDCHVENDAHTPPHTHPHHSHHNPLTYTHTTTRSHLQIGWYGILRFFLKKIQLSTRRTRILMRFTISTILLHGTNHKSHGQNLGVLTKF